MFRPTAVLLFTIVCSAAVAEEISKETLQNIAAIDYRGIGFSSTQQDLLKALPGNDHVSSSKGVSTYEIRDDASNDCVLLRFSDDELVEIDFIYFPSRVSSKGGEEVLTNRALERFGTPTKREDKTILWDFPTIDRIVVSSYENENWSLHVYHRSRRLEIPGYKDASATPKASRIQITVGLAVPYKSKTPTSVAGSIHRPQKMPTRVFKFLKGKIARDYPTNRPMQAYSMEKQLAAYTEMANMSTPDGMAGSHFFRLKSTAVRKHPYNYSTQLYVLKRYINEYLMYREAGTSGGAILRYLLRYE